MSVNGEPIVHSPHVSLYVRQMRETSPIDHDELARGLAQGRINRERMAVPPPGRDQETLMVAFCAVLLAILVALTAFQVALGP